MKAFLLIAAGALFAATPAFAASPLAGNWTNPSGSVTVRIGPCGGSMCGRVVSASADAKAKAAEGGTDQLVGTALMSDIEQTGSDSWTADVFVPDHNVHAEGTLRLTGPRTLDVQGCAMGGLVCKSQTWTKASAPARRRR